MQHNRPYYGKKAAVLISADNISELRFSLPRWLEQSHTNRQIWLVETTANRCLPFTKKTVEMYGATLGNTPDANCRLFTGTLEQASTAAKDSGVEIICEAPGDFIPMSYFLESAIILMEEGCSYSGRGIKVYPAGESNLTEHPLLPRSDFHGMPGDNALLTVYLPCMNRLQYLIGSLPHWFKQTYSNLRIVVIDYSSREPIAPAVQKVCDEYGRTFSTDQTPADVMVLRKEGMKWFNIGHCYNFAATKFFGELLLFSCCDSNPWDFTCELYANATNSETFSQIHFGLHCITHKAWLKLLHCEQSVGWGNDDCCFRQRAIMMGLKLVILPSKLVFQVPQTDDAKGENRQIKDISESALTNQTRCRLYRERYGWLANYGLPCGGDEPVPYRYESMEEKTMRMYCWKSDTMSKTNPPAGVKYHPESDTFYVVTEHFFKPEEIGILPYSQYYISSEDDVEKYLLKVRSELP